ncbi:hypothetical protein TNIN_355051 [Trichonephila inaurata madagascariensis]|uniref:Uncharacterized protein n=1 Tax=Trichonephila inaurata madagascariensis TaxID=2747483 RepID=A0A8X6YAA9_9ARAC|nr:hypothetical protein TNIN_355051 [Trichonephila inaurata madagascariensis]
MLPDVAAFFFCRCWTTKGRCCLALHLLMSPLVAVRVRKLLGREELGDRKPSQFLGHLRSLAGDIGIKPTLLHSLLLQRLPLHVPAILQGQSTLEPDQMADMAYRILEVPLLTSIPSVNYQSHGCSNISQRFGDIRITGERVEDLAK